MGDFGRTPKINNKVGRDHWPQCYSVVLARKPPRARNDAEEGAGVALGVGEDTT
jgi:hypothetical protein